MSSVSARLKDATAPTVKSILRHPFIVDLTAGTLSQDAFGRYIAQNYLYLGAYAGALASIAARWPEPDMITFFSRRSAYTVESEQAFAAGLMKEVDLDPAVVSGASPTPAGLGYATFIKQAAALEPIPVALAAMLPCYIVYNDVAKHLVTAGSPTPSYQRWIEMYVGESFEDGVSGVQQALDVAADGATDATVERMFDHVLTACRYEWLFWESAYNDLGWPDTA